MNTTADISRRSFIAGSGSLAIGVSFGLGALDLAQAEGAGFNPNGWVHIAADNTVTLMSPAAEMGQGTMTAMPMLLAEELDLDWSKVKVIQAPATPRSLATRASVAA